jgi:hypothetical protein
LAAQSTWWKELSHNTMVQNHRFKGTGSSSRMII